MAFKPSPSSKQPRLCNPTPYSSVHTTRGMSNISGSKHDLFTLLHVNPRREKCEYDDDTVLKIIRRNPDVARTKYYFGGGHGRAYIPLYPLSQAVTLGASLDVVRMIHEAHPDAIQDVDTHGWTALHYSCCYRASHDVVLYLADKYPFGVELRDVGGKTPLHLACLSSAPAEVVGMLAERYPAAMNIKDKYKRTPLDIAKRHASPEIVALLTTLHNLLCLCPNDEGIIAMLLEWSGNLWSYEVAPILHSHPLVAQRMEVRPTLMPTLLGRVGLEGRVETVYQIVRETMTLFKA